MNKIGTDTAKLNIRRDKLEAESRHKRCCRLIEQWIRSLFIFSLIGIYPVMITFVIIPRFGSSDAVVLSSIGSYLSFILVLQMMGTYRGLKSFSEKNKNRKNVEQCAMVAD